MDDILIMECCNTQPQCAAISGDATAYLYCPVCGMTSKSFSVRHKIGSYYECSNRKELEEVIESWNKSVSESEERKMKVFYKGFAGNLLKLEAEKASDGNFFFCEGSLTVKHAGNTWKYTLELWDEEKAAKISFSGVSLKDVKFLGGEVTFG